MGILGEELSGVLGEEGLDDFVRAGLVCDEWEWQEGAAVDIRGVWASLVLGPLRVCFLDELGVGEELGTVGREVRSDYSDVSKVPVFPTQ